MELFNECNIRQLADLLNISGESDSDDELKSKTSKLGPGSIGAPKPTDQKTETVEKSRQNKTSKDIWEEEEVEVQEGDYDDMFDPREEPTYDMIYKQGVTTEDVFLQIGSKGPSTASCENMVIKIYLPGLNSKKEIDLDVTEKFLSCKTKKFRLGLNLPHQVDPQKTKAEWHDQSETLIVTVTLVREYDKFHF